jgi:hypothetical protein
MNDSNLFEDVYGFHSGQCCVCACVTHFSTSPFDGLLESITGQDGENRRGRRIITDLSDASRYHLRDIIAVWRLASYDRTEAEDRNIFAALCKLFCSYGNFTGARHPAYEYLFVGGTVTFEAIYRAGEQLSGYKFVEPADYNSVTAFAGCYPTFYFFNHSFTSPNNILNPPKT